MIPTRRVRLLVDAAVIGWAIAWVVIGLQIGREMREVAQLSDTVVLAGGAIEQTGDLLVQVGRIPFLGQPVGDLAERIRETGRSAQENAGTTRSSVEDLSVLLAVAVALAPTLPPAGLWLALRLRWRRERLAVRRALAAGVPGLEALLAQRARASLPFDAVLALGDDDEALAAAELKRLGLRRVG